MCQHVWRIALFYNKKTASHDAVFSYQKQERGILSISCVGEDKDNNTNETHKKQEYHYCIVVPLSI